jgi:hypothetical protein
MRMKIRCFKKTGPVRGDRKVNYSPYTKHNVFLLLLVRLNINYVHAHSKQYIMAIMAKNKNMGLWVCDRC